MKTLRLWLRKEEIDPEALSGSTAVVIDVLLATTTLQAIVEGGACRVFPTGSMEEALRLHQSLDSPQVLTGGEEDGLLIDGFDCGPFPDEFGPDKVKGKDVVFLSTNGTRAIAGARSASRLLIACLRNAPSVARYLSETDSDDIYLICSGSKGRVSLEDTLCAAVILSRMDTRGWKLDDAAWLVREFGWTQQQKTGEILQQARVGRWFMQNDKADLLRYVGDIGASHSLIEVKNGRLHLLPPHPQSASPAEP
ncbi:2-phosphosulfolactate phosphatase [Melghirimyces profundicolus]|uniref:Probable 2-phosphosulfolactate phosphatase n=1 Tax=Melghirimyces profundicolus TaxID=1242148 RepID=A0A2T6BGF0_9BACL|nr:2-phosphosulfolactate phosphatase [Melghirimyces profundicolus]PTX55145.1 2-phosphosulfolactate phosphatase [Melghirimyces profundicolus]